MSCSLTNSEIVLTGIGFSQRHDHGFKQQYEAAAWPGPWDYQPAVFRNRYIRSSALVMENYYKQMPGYRGRHVNLLIIKD